VLNITKFRPSELWQHIFRCSLCSQIQTLHCTCLDRVFSPADNHPAYCSGNVHRTHIM